MNAQAKGDFERARALYERALSITEKARGPEHDDVAMILNNLAEAYRERNDYARAEPLYQRALAVREKTLPADHPLVALTVNNLALLYQERGDHARAEPLLRRALAAYEKTLGENHADVATLLNNLALVYEATGDAARAEAAYRRAARIAEQALGGRHPTLARVTYNTALLAAGRGDFKQSLELLARAADIREHNISLVLSTGSEQQKQTFLDTLYGETNLTLSFHLRSLPADAGAARLALETLLRRKGRALDVMSDQIGALRRRLKPEDRQLLDRLSDARSRLAALVLAGGGADAGARQEEVKRLDAEVQRLEDEVGARSSSGSEELRAGAPVFARAATVERVQAAIPADAALVELVRYHPFDFKAQRGAAFGAARYAAYVVRREGAPAWVELGDAAAIEAGVREMRAAVSTPARADAKQAARALDELAARPFRKLLGETRRVFLSPDGALNLVPFGALVDEDGKYLVEKYSITYLTSGRDLLRLAAAGNAVGGKQTAGGLNVNQSAAGVANGQGATIIADPLFGASDAPPAAPSSTDGGPSRRSAELLRASFAPLPGTAGEAQALGALLRGASVLTREAATEAALKRVAAPRVLHVATHGFFLPDQSQEPDGGGRARSQTLRRQRAAPRESFAALGPRARGGERAPQRRRRGRHPHRPRSRRPRSVGHEARRPLGVRDRPR